MLRYLCVLLVFTAIACQDASGVKTLTRDAFRESVIGKTEAQVIELHGKPVDSSETGDERLIVFRKVTRDPVTEKTDFATFVSIDKKTGKVKSVSY